VSAGNSPVPACIAPAAALAGPVAQGQLVNAFGD